MACLEDWPEGKEGQALQGWPARKPIARQSPLTCLVSGRPSGNGILFPAEKGFEGQFAMERRIGYQIPSCGA